MEIESAAVRWVAGRAVGLVAVAARALAAQGQSLAAMPLLDLAMEAAVADDDPELADDIRSLLDEIAADASRPLKNSAGD